MGIALTGVTPAATRLSLIKFGDSTPATSSLKTISDGAGNDLPFQVSTAAFNFTAAPSYINSASSAGTVNDGFKLFNTTSSSSGSQQFSQSIHWQGQGWKTNATAGSQPIDFRAYVQTYQGTSAPFGYLVFDAQVNNGGYSSTLYLMQGGPGFVIGSSSSIGTQTYNFGPNTSFFAGVPLGVNGGGVAGFPNYGFGSSLRSGMFGSDQSGATYTAFCTNNIERMRFVHGGNASIGGVFTPTAVLHFAAGTDAAGTAPVKLTLGTPLSSTTSEAGAIEYSTISGVPILSIVRDSGIGREAILCGTPTSGSFLTPVINMAIPVVAQDGNTYYLQLTTP